MNENVDKMVQLCAWSIFFCIRERFLFWKVTSFEHQICLCHKRIKPLLLFDRSLVIDSDCSWVSTSFSPVFYFCFFYWFYSFLYSLYCSFCITGLRSYDISFVFLGYCSASDWSTCVQYYFQKIKTTNKYKCSHLIIARSEFCY